jgi:hypothetical protein
MKREVYQTKAERDSSSHAASNARRGRGLGGVWGVNLSRKRKILNEKTSWRSPVYRKTLKILFIRIKFSNTKRHDRMNSSPASYSGGPEIISRPEYRLSLLRTLLFLFF